MRLYKQVLAATASQGVAQAAGRLGAGGCLAERRRGKRPRERRSERSRMMGAVQLNLHL